MNIQKKSGPNSQPPLGGSKMMMTYGVNFTLMIKLNYKKLIEQKYMNDTVGKVQIRTNLLIT